MEGPASGNMSQSHKSPEEFQEEDLKEDLKGSQVPGNDSSPLMFTIDIPWTFDILPIPQPLSLSTSHLPSPSTPPEYSETIKEDSGTLRNGKEQGKRNLQEDDVGREEINRGLEMGELETPKLTETSYPILVPPRDYYDNFAYASGSRDKCQTQHKREGSSGSLSSSAATSGVGRTCRICWIGDEKERCIRPCRCDGSLAFVHSSCLQTWLRLTNAKSCEICQYNFQTKKRTKPLKEWSWNFQKSPQIFHLKVTVALLGIAAAPLLCGIILCGQKVAEYMSGTSDAWKAVALLALIFISVIAYTMAVFYCGRKVYALCSAWVDSHQTTVIILTDGTSAALTNKTSCSYYNPAGPS